MEPLDITNYILKEAEKKYNISFKVDIENKNNIDVLEILNNGYIIMGNIDIKLKLADNNKILGIRITNDSDGFFVYDKDDEEIDCYYNEDKIIWYFKYLLYD